ncbi:hypothetical protein VOLCADRAFT_88681 [Volvox carteri f. nagariensis]|uniref:Uncharacterized protein n=1 Tax=Volvox carteri f. nagariensis TaxID=3068 RepID=D8TPN6_VOLCA|nr:uncharacterized protein VOLCADRAFT_88681 [Volvox carteri f. nagariensis]EFJ50798.1 hypothetical protein VOLCADRAFT_88681 [Volvox carteri f. nagariensis]|eukprot:XP_002948391.1 hypothetical protein VOLCADRAFT_88681 [Volvox carteri f. nagariensis]
MDAAEGLEQLFAAHSAVPALAVLQLLRKDLSQQQAQILFKNHRHCLQMGTCSFGRRGRAAYALRTGTEVQRLRLDFSQQSLKSCCTTTGAYHDNHSNELTTDSFVTRTCLLSAAHAPLLKK